MGRGRGVKEVGEKERRGRGRGRRKDEGEMERDGGRNPSFSFERHFQLTKTFPIHYLPAGVASIKPILQMTNCG